MSRKKRPAPEPEEREPSRAGGALVLTALAGAGLGGVYAASPAAAVGVVWVAGAGALWKATRSVRHAANPAPPPVSEGAADEKPQFTIVEDREGHCTVKWQKRGPATAPGTEG
ncbi:hypothetical protein AB0891_25550 [Streptomyces sp. NPDC007259]|uniref:hypothetical protein n=1 Tax=Streptomyces sp. NPDC007259 TaxID=3154319 RepID=UPI0034562D7E